MAGDARRVLSVGSYQLSRRGAFSKGSSHGGASGPRFLVEWDENRLRLKASDEEAKGLADVEWGHVTGIWVSLRNHADRHYRVSMSLQVTLETSHSSCPLDFARFSAAMDGAGGEFLHFLQTSLGGRLKEGRAPSFTTSKWACPLYAAGSFTANSLRIFLGRLSIGVEILYSVCFFAQLHQILVSRERRLASAIGELIEELHIVLWESWSAVPGLDAGLPFLVQIPVLLFGGVPHLVLRLLWTFVWHSSNGLVLIMLMQHVVMVMMTFDALWRTFRGAWKSLMTFHKAAKRIDKAVKKSKTGGVAAAGAQPSAPPQDAVGGSASSTNEAKGDKDAGKSE